MSRRAGFMVGALALLLSAPLLSGGASAESRHRLAARGPNVIVIQSDDQPVSWLSERTMPNTERLLASDGTTFRQYVTTSPNCCPSRASLITGQYPHNHGVLSNRVGYKGLLHKPNTLPAWLQAAGYHTVHIGKYMNGFPGPDKNPVRPAPGWDEWYTLLRPGYYDYDMSVNGVLESHGREPNDYSGRVITRRAVGVEKRRLPLEKPLYLQVDYYGPHYSTNDPLGACDGAAVPDQADRDLFVDEPLPMGGSFNEDDVADKPPFIRRLPSLSDEDIANIQRQHACGLATLASVDRGVGKIYDQVRDAGELRNTVFLFLSDNGVFEGQHRIPREKQQAYEDDIRVPLIVRLPGNGSAPLRSGASVANIDIAPTILDLAKGKSCRSPRSCRVMDGRSMMPLLGGPGSFPARRDLAIEFDLVKGHSSRNSTCAFAGYRNPQLMYVEHTRAVSDSVDRVCRPVHEVEHYNLDRDPQQLRNLAAAPLRSGETQRLAAYAARLDRLRDCAGIRGRDPRPKRGHYCD